jgi:hypothetical protein
MIYVMRREEHSWNVSVLQIEHLSNFVCNSYLDRILDDSFQFKGDFAGFQTLCLTSSSLVIVSYSRQNLHTD